MGDNVKVKKIIWEDVGDKHWKEVIPKGFRRVRNDNWIRKRFGLWDGKGKEHIVFFNSETKETLIWFVWLYGGKWVVRLGRIVEVEISDKLVKEYKEIFSKVRDRARVAYRPGNYELCDELKQKLGYAEWLFNRGDVEEAIGYLKEECGWCLV
jgi:hypothetical protein